MSNAPDNCPWHDLDPSETVWIQHRSHSLPYSAALACDNWHIAAALAPAMAEAGRRVQAAAVESFGVLGAAFRRS
jgi:hypothetical protein